jgi:hypothetical protein
MSSYVPDYLIYNERQADGWPNGISSKTWAEGKIKSLLATEGQVDLELARRELFEASDRPEDFRNRAMYQYQYAVTHRALLAADGKQVWVKG